MTDPTPDPVEPPAAHHLPRWKKILALSGAGIVITPVVLIVLWTWIALHWSYSEGERAGTLQKFSSKGWLCKTWEGELQISTIPGSAPVLWEFSVRDQLVAAKLLDAVAHDGRVVLSYEEHRGIPTTCFGETPYFVTEVRVVR